MVRGKLKLDVKNCIIIIISLLFVILGFVLDDIWQISYIKYKSIVLIAINTVSISILLSVVWDSLCKRTFAEEILKLNGISENYIESGIEYVLDSFKEINWEKELGRAKNVTIFICYGYTWRNNNRNVLKKIAEKGNLTIILPNYTNDVVIDELDRQFRYGKYSNNRNQSCKEWIKSAIVDFNEMGANIKLYNSSMHTSYYMIDDILILAPFKHNKEKIDVPVMKVNSYGTLIRFYKKDLESIIRESIEWEEEA